MDQSGWRALKAAGIKVERRQVRPEVDVQPLAPSRLGVPHGMAHQRRGNALPLMLAGDLGIEQEGMIASVPGHVDKTDQAAAGQASGHPAQAAGPDLVPTTQARPGRRVR
jgi:hypothetical protein